MKPDKMLIVIFLELSCSYGILMSEKWGGKKKYPLSGLVHIKTTLNSFAMQVIHQLS